MDEVTPLVLVSAAFPKDKATVLWQLLHAWRRSVPRNIVSVFKTLYNRQHC